MATLKQSTAFTRMFKLVSSTDHLTAKTGATAVVNLSKAGGAFGVAGGTVTEVANGWYKVALTTTDTNTLGDLAYYITASGADDTDFLDQVTAQILGDTLNASVTQWNGTNVSAPATAGIPEVNVKNINNVSAASVTTINANQGTTQPINFTGTGASALAKSDMVDIAGAAVSTSTAQIGVNAVQFGGAAVTATTSVTIPPASTLATTTGAVGSVTGNVGGNVVGSVGSVSTGVTVITNSDKSGYSLTGNQSIGSLTISGGITVTQSTANGHGISATGNGTGHGILATSGSGVTGDGVRAVAASTNGNGLTGVKTGTGSDLNCTSTPLTLAKTTNITGFNDIAATAVVSAGAITTSAGAVSAVTTVGSVTGAVGSVTAGVTVTTNNDKTGYGLSAAAVQAVWDALTSALTTAGSIGKKLADWVIGTTQTGDSYARLGAPAGASVSADVASIKADTGTTIPGRLPAALTGAGNMKADALALNGDATAAATLAILNGANVVYRGTVTGAATTTTLIDGGLTQATTDWWKGRILVFTSVIVGQATDITAFDPATDKLTFTAVTTAPTGATYVII